MTRPKPSISANNIPGETHFLSPDILTFISSRGYVDEDDPYSSFNACHYTGDNPRHVADCRHALCRHLGIAGNRLIIPRQTHSVNVTVIDTVPADDAALDGSDAIVTAMPDVALAINTADCVPILLADTANGIIAAVHSGWKGTVGRIAARTVDVMVSLGAKHSEIKAVMGPCICGECFEVGDEVTDRFTEAGLDGDKIILHRHPRNHIDLPQAVRQTLIQAGVPAENIAMPAHCSRCEHDRYFSARRLGIESGRTLSLIMRRSNPQSNVISES